MHTPSVPVELTGRPFTTADARAVGISKHALQSAPWRRMLRDVWSHIDMPDTRETRLAAVRLLLPPYAVLCGLTAAWVHGADVRREEDVDVHVGFPKGRRFARASRADRLPGDTRPLGLARDRRRTGDDAAAHGVRLPASPARRLPARRGRCDDPRRRPGCASP